MRVVGPGAVTWAYGFRAFFLLAASHAVVMTGWWTLSLAGRAAPPFWLQPIRWHAHEMLYGFVCAAAAGFLLTAVSSWTGARPVTGGRLAGLAALWLGGRIAVALAGVLPAPWVALADLAFLPALAVAVGIPVLRARQPRNYGFPLLVAALAAANLLVHLEAAGWTRGTAATGVRAAVDLILVLVVVVGGRITPVFTANALRRLGRPERVRADPRLAGLSVAAVVLFAVADTLAPRSAASGWAALLAAGLLALRMAGWRTLRTRHEPLLWSLHLGYAWLWLGLAALALADLTGAVAWTTALHALTAGAFGSMILAVMTRVALAHTGRELAAPRGVAWAYALVTAGALVRTVGPLLAPGIGPALLQTAGALWGAAFVVYLLVYAPILVSPRVDGLPG